MVAIQRPEAGKDGARGTPMQIGWPGEPSQEGTFLIKIKKKEAHGQAEADKLRMQMPMARMTVEAS